MWQAHAAAGAKATETQVLLHSSRQVTNPIDVVTTVVDRKARNQIFLSFTRCKDITRRPRDFTSVHMLGPSPGHRAESIDARCLQVRPQSDRQT
jgi:hypothetical protein